MLLDKLDQLGSFYADAFSYGQTPRTTPQNFKSVVLDYMELLASIFEAGKMTYALSTKGLGRHPKPYFLNPKP